MLKILFAASEMSSFAKTGGLGDVVGSLPKALRELGVDARVVLPYYKTISDSAADIDHIKDLYVNLSWRKQYTEIKMTEEMGVPVYFIDNEYYFNRDCLYGYDDEAERFAFFDRAVLEMLECIDFIPDIIHCNDWQTGLIPVYLYNEYRHRDSYKDIKTIFTIHNLQYQGVFPSYILMDILGLDDSYFTKDNLEFYGSVNFMKGGIVFSDFITTVSPTYSRQVLTDFYGEKLNGLLYEKRHKLTGILNGIDYDLYNPEIDRKLVKNYGIKNPEEKLKNKICFQQKYGLPANKDMPMMGIVSRLVNQKGFDLIVHVIKEIMSMDIQLVVLGTGDPYYEELFQYVERQYADKAYVNIGFDVSLADEIYAASDIFLMPSLFEPCGLSQLIALRYGCIPIVRETGGLKDTIIPYNEFTGEGNGFSFANYNAHDMLYTIERAVGFYSNKNVWSSLVKQAMLCDYSWNASAQKYMELYQNLVSQKAGLSEDNRYTNYLVQMN